MPFAIALHHSSGTVLFPLLGSGVHVSRLDAEAFVAGSPIAKYVAALPLMAVDPGRFPGHDRRRGLRRWPCVAQA